MLAALVAAGHAQNQLEDGWLLRAAERSKPARAASRSKAVLLDSDTLPYDDSSCEQWTGIPESADEALPPMECGVMWFLHVPKTGGTTMSHHFHDHAEEQGWKYANMWKLRIPEEERGESEFVTAHSVLPPEASRLWGVWDNSEPGTENWKAWNTSDTWRRALKELESPQPKLIVHAHHNMPGLGDPYMVEQVLQPMKDRLEDKGCELRFSTILREPVAEVTSLMLFNKIPQEQFVQSMQRQADGMTKYLVYNYQSQWPRDLSQAGPTPRPLGEKMLSVARNILSDFALVGRTEELDAFMRAVNQALGWPVDLHTKRWNTGNVHETREMVSYQPTPEQVSLVKQANAIDSALYHTFCSAPPPRRASGLRLATALVQRSRTPDTVFGSLTTVPYRSSNLASILQSFETVEHDFFVEHAAVSGLKLLGFNVYVDQTSTLTPELQDLAEKHPWASLIVKPGPEEYGQAHSLNLALAALKASGAKYWLKWEDAWNPQRPFIGVASELLGSPRPGRFVHDSGRPIVDVNFAAIHFRYTANRNRDAGLPMPVLLAKGERDEEAAETQHGVGFWRITNASMQPTIQSRCDDLFKRRFEMRDPGEQLEDYWPNWSLRPGLTRADLALEVGNFSTKAILWPYWFETVYACKYFTKHPDTVDGFVVLDEDDYTVRINNDSLPGRNEHTYRSHGGEQNGECSSWCDKLGKYACTDQRCSGCGKCDAEAPEGGADAGVCGQWCGVPGRAALRLQKREVKRGGQCGLLWFTHPPRTGGTTVWNILKRKAMGNHWKYHDSANMDSGQPTRNDSFSYRQTKAWDSFLNDLEEASPRVAFHHHDNMPGLSNTKLRSFLARTKVSLEAKGCKLTMVTVLRAPISRALSDAGTHNFIDEEEVRAYSEVRHNAQSNYLVFQQPKPKTYCDAEKLATSKYRKIHQRLMPDWCFHRDDAPLQQARANLALFDIVGNREDLLAFLTAVSSAVGWHGPTEDTAGVQMQVTRINRGFSDGNVLAVAQHNQADFQLYTDMCAPSAKGSCDAVRRARQEARASAWEALERSQPYDKVVFWKVQGPMHSASALARPTDAPLVPLVVSRYGGPLCACSLHAA